MKPNPEFLLMTKYPIKNNLIDLDKIDLKSFDPNAIEMPKWVYW